MINILFLSALLSCASSKAQHRYLITDFGARTSSSLNTEAIQRAIDRASSDGGGMVIVPKGTFTTGTLYIKSNINLHLDSGATLLGSADWSKYAKLKRWYALLFATGASNVSITGQGTIDGNCTALVEDVKAKIQSGIIDQKYLKRNRPGEDVRPQLIEFTGCDKLVVSDVTLQNAAGWTETYIHCTNMLVERVKVRSFLYWTTDGIDLNDCQHVVLRNMDIKCEDDGICLKSYDPLSSCNDISISDCRISSGSSAFKFGTPSFGGFKNITVKNLEIVDSYRSAIALEMVDGGVIDSISISHVVAKRASGSLFIRLGKRNQRVAPGIIRNVSITDVELLAEENLRNPYQVKYDAPPAAEASKAHNAYPAMIVGIPGYRPTKIEIKNLTIKLPGGGLRSRANISLDSLATIPEKESAYPEINMFGELPASCLYLRHVKNVLFQNVKIVTVKDDERPSLVFDDVLNTKFNKLTILSSSKPVIVMKDSQIDFNGLSPSNALKQTVK